MARSEPKHFAMAELRPQDKSWSTIQAAFQTSNLAASNSVAIWAILKAVAWKVAIGWPNWTLVLEYSIAYSRAALANPTPAAPTAALVRSKVLMAIRKPWPTLPRIFSAGTRTSSKNISAVLEALCPILSSILPIVIPGVSLGTIKAVRPRAPFCGAALAKTTYRLATPPFVIKHLEPFMI